MVSKVKTGPLLYFDRGTLTKKWREGYFNLYQDSTIQWFEKPTDKKHDGLIRIKDACQYLTVGPYTRNVPGRPSLPKGGDENLFISIAKDMQRKEKEILWILCNDLTQLNEWMKAIVSTLPPLPQAPSNPNAQPPHSNPSANYRPQQPANYNPAQKPYSGAPSIPNSQPSHFTTNPSANYRPQQPSSYYGANSGGNTTVVVNPNPNVVVTGGGYGGYHGYHSGDDFALGLTLGWAWHSSGSGWGCGNAWGGHYNHHGPVFHDGPDYTINNYNINNITDNDNNNINNIDNNVNNNFDHGNGGPASTLHEDREGLDHEAYEGGYAGNVENGYDANDIINTPVPANEDNGGVDYEGGYAGNVENQNDNAPVEYAGGGDSGTFAESGAIDSTGPSDYGGYDSGPTTDYGGGDSGANADYGSYDSGATADYGSYDSGATADYSGGD